MTVREVIEATDRRKPNLYSREEKLRWLEEAEGMAWGGGGHGGGGGVDAGAAHRHS